MTKNIKFFLLCLLISLPFWWGINVLEKNLEDFFFWQEMAKSPQIFFSQVGQKQSKDNLEDLKPIRDWEVEDLRIEAKAAISVEIDDKGQQKVLFKKNSDKTLSIASLTKLMTASIILEYYDLSQIVEISETAVGKEGEAGNFKIGDKFRVKDLLYSLLIESSNDAAQALAEVIGEKAFVNLMNLEAENLNLENTHFANPIGFDEPGNYSTTEDLVKLTNYLLKKPLIWEILSTPEFNLDQLNGVFHHKLSNTNKLLGSPTKVWWGTGIVGGKTGWTPQAGGCFLLVLKNPKNQGYLINVILDSKDKFEEMKRLVDWTLKAYQW